MAKTLENVGVTGMTAQLQAQYLQFALAGKVREADRLVTAALEQGMRAGDIYLDLFQPVCAQVGMLWQNKSISVAHEHLVTALIERQMGDLHSHFRPTALKQKTLLIGSVEKESHCLGARMVADFFEQDGWTVHYLGAGVPTRSFLALARDLRADLIGLSCQMVYNLPAITEFMDQTARFGLDGIRVMAGGLPFVQQPELFMQLGINFSGRDAREALENANQYGG